MSPTVVVRAGVPLHLCYSSTSESFPSAGVVHEKNKINTTEIDGDGSVTPVPRLIAHFVQCIQYLFVFFFLLPHAVTSRVGQLLSSVARTRPFNPCSQTIYKFPILRQEPSF